MTDAARSRSRCEHRRGDRVASVAADRPRNAAVVWLRAL